MNDLSFVIIELKVEDASSLAILLHEDGTINRQGNGSLKIDKTFCLGVTETSKILRELGDLIDADFESHLGHAYDLPDMKGKLCSLEIKLSAMNGMSGIKFNFGSDSSGPPSSVTDFVLKAVELTNLWYNKAKSSNKKRWQFWK